MCQCFWIKFLLNWQFIFFEHQHFPKTSLFPHFVNKYTWNRMSMLTVLCMCIHNDIYCVPWWIKQQLSGLRIRWRKLIQPKKMSKRKKERSRANECATRSVKPARLFYSRTRLHIFMTIETTTMLSYSHTYKKNLLDIFVLSFFPYSHSRICSLTLALRI